MLCFLIEFRQIDKLLLLLLLFFFFWPFFFFTFLTLAFRLLCAEKETKRKGGKKLSRNGNSLSRGAHTRKRTRMNEIPQRKQLDEKSLAEFLEGVIVRKKGALHDK